ncbi:MULTISPECIES: hypothetical protein [Rhizobium]|uniref:hypothetical protein n=1 Tax=Rhizobium TaxID=379 RepID=UPI001C8318BE|nr:MULTISPECIES: hypothetical protein [Rhizobium]MBX4899694.1 hypothetical protein [Rhizobium bangladeshense]MBX5297611.1 hypothetical protein [Rhizobium sp. NLR15a]
MNLERAIRQPRTERLDLRIMALQFDRLDDGQDVGDALAALIRAGKQPVLPADCNAPFILPMSAMTSRSITAGIRILAREFLFAVSKTEQQAGF